MEAFRIYEIAAKMPEGAITGKFNETAGVLQPATSALDLPLIDEWKIDDDVAGVQVRLVLYGDAKSKRLVPINSDPAFRLMRLFRALACFRNGRIAHGLELIHLFQYADGLETGTAVDLLTETERKNLFLEGYLGPWKEQPLAQLTSLAAIAGIDPRMPDPILDRTIREWYETLSVWTTRIAGFAYQANHFLRMENGIEKSKVSTGDECRLVREPYNPSDPNAVMVMHQSGRKLGYLRRTIANYIAPLMDLGALYRAKVCAFLSDEFTPDARLYLSVERLG